MNIINGGQSLEMTYFDIMELEGQTNIFDFIEREQMEMKFGGELDAQI